MKYNQNRLLLYYFSILFVLILGFLLYQKPVAAQNDQLQKGVNLVQDSTNESDRQAEQEQRQLQRQDQLQQRVEARCETIKIRLEKHLSNIETRADSRESKYQRILDKLNNLALRFENNGVDAGELRIAITELSDSVSDFKTSYQAYVADVQNAANIACSGDSEIKQALQQARVSLDAAKTDASAVKDYAQTELRSLLDSLKNQITSQKNSNESEN